MGTKNSDFEHYISEQDGLPIFPHIRSCVDTHDIKSSIGTLRRFHIICEGRYARLKEMSVTNISEYNTEVMKNRTSDTLVLPTVFCIIDELQEVIKAADNEERAEVMAELTYIFRFGSAVGVHLIITASNTDIISDSKILDYFPLRFEMENPEVTSEAVSSTTEHPCVYLNAKTITDSIRFVVPYFSKEEMQEEARILRECAECYEKLLNLFKHQTDKSKLG